MNTVPNPLTSISASTDAASKPPNLRRPRLLVSIRSTDEAQLALQSGVEVLDVKEPKQGSLGMAPLETIEAITKLPEVSSRSIPLSVALGELTDWPQPVNIPTLPGGITFAKLGLAGASLLPDWKRLWMQTRTKFDLRAESRLNWVAVAYADHSAAQSPTIEEVIQAAKETQCAGLLIDTWSKDSQTLLDFVSVSQLTEIAARCHLAGLFLALAGKLNLDLLLRLANVETDLLAIRSAACRETDRTAELDANCIQQFLERMNQCCRAPVVEQLTAR